MKQKSEIKKFIESVLDSSVSVDQQSMICSTELSLIGGDNNDGNARCENSATACGATNKIVCYNSGNFCNLSDNQGRCFNMEPALPPTNGSCDPPIVDNQCEG